LSNLKRHERKAIVLGISASDSIERFRHRLSRELSSTKVEDRGQYVLMHERVRLNGNFIDIIVYTTDRIYISASINIPSETFNDIATKVVRIAQESLKKMEVFCPATLLRAKYILEFASKLNLENEQERMILLILSDISNEIVLGEEMRDAGIEVTPSDEYITNKIERLKEKGKIVCEEEGIKGIHELRNGIVHRGDIPNKIQAKKALQTAQTVLKGCLKE